MKKVILSRPARSARNPLEQTPPLPPSKGGVREGGRLGSGDNGKNEEEKERSEVEEVLASIQALSLANQKRCYEALALSLATSAADDRDVGMWTHAVHSALVRAIGGQGGGLPGPMAIRRLLAARSSWASIEGFMVGARLVELAVAERQACYHLLAKLLVDRSSEVARFAGIPLSAKLVASNAGDIAAVVARSFPGYVSSGLFRMVALREHRGEEPLDEPGG